MINYSVVIPHKNSYLLLKRCLDSIPQREDVEIIVVDDHSDDVNAVRKTVETNSIARLYDNEGYGAGGARNTGLKYTTGKWLLFADCDDYYVEGFLDVLDKYVESNYDVIYFNFFQYLEGKDEPVYEKIGNYIKECAEGKRDVDYVKYRNNVPWNKMFKKEFIEFYCIRFEEQPIGNDVFFSYQTGYLSKNTLVVKEKLYNYIVYKRSLTNSNWTRYKIKTYLEYLKKYSGFMEFVGHKDWSHGFPFLCYQLFKSKSLNRTFKVLLYYFSHFRALSKCRHKYPTILMQKTLESKYKNVD